VPDELEPYVSQLRAALDGELEGYLRTDNASRAMWSTDASIYLRKPVGVVVARSEEDIRRALSAARGLGLSITPRGTGTSLLMSRGKRFESAPRLSVFLIHKRNTRHRRSQRLATVGFLTAL
jgi:hypothetical protein